MLQWVVICLSLLSILEPVKLQNDDVSQTLHNVNILLGSLVTKSNTQLRELQALRADLTSLSDTVSNLNDSVTSLHDQLRSLRADLISLSDTVTSLNDSVMSLHEQRNEHKSKHKSKHDCELQTNISESQCLDTEDLVQLLQTMWSNVSYKLDDIPGNVQRILGLYTCGGTGGWRRVVYLDFTDTNTACPSGWQLTGYSKRTCGRASTGSSCDSVSFPVNGREYSKVCGRIKAYQWGSPDGFNTASSIIGGNYVDGISVTHGNPRKHIWTFAGGLSEDVTTLYPAGACPCDNNNGALPPAFVGDDYFCESGLHEPWDHTQFYFFPDDLLWDGQNCSSTSTCCSLNSPLYFVKELPSSAADNIEARICFDQQSGDENIAVELIELYVQ